MLGCRGCSSVSAQSKSLCAFYLLCKKLALFPPPDRFGKRWRNRQHGETCGHVSREVLSQRHRIGDDDESGLSGPRELPRRRSNAGATTYRTHGHSLPRYVTRAMITRGAPVG
jgi:hypothetical protein